MPQTTPLPHEALRYCKGDRWLPVPGWANGFAQLGRSLRTVGLDPSEKAVIALALPIHEWGAAFLTLGYLLGAQHTAEADESAESHFRRLMDLPCGTPVKLLHNGLQFDAVVDEKKKESAFILYTKKEGMTGKVASRRTLLECSRANCQKVRFIDAEQFEGVRARGRVVSDSADFLSALLPDGDVVGHCLGSRVDYIIVGDVGRLREEVFTPFMCREKEGCLQDALRIRNFSKPTQDHCGLIKAAMSRTDGETTDDTAGIVIHESAAAYLRHHSALASPVEVVLLDRSERAFVQAATDISTRFASRLQKELEQLPLHICDGVETIAFLEARGT